MFGHIILCILFPKGLFQVAGLSINVLTYIIIVVSIGLLVDFVMHVLLRYFESHGKTREEKIKEMMTTMGTSILLGGTSTFLGTMPLVFSQSLVFSTAFSAFVIMVLLGLSHGLILLPVLLSLFGTTSSPKHPSITNRSESIPEDYHHDLELSVNDMKQRHSSSSESDTESHSSSGSSSSDENQNQFNNNRSIITAVDDSTVSSQTSIMRAFSGKLDIRNLSILPNTSIFSGFEAVTPAQTVHRQPPDSEFIEMTI